MTQLDLRRRIVRYLIEADEPTHVLRLQAAVRNDLRTRSHISDMLADGMLISVGACVAIRNLSDAEQWLIDTMPRTPAEQE